MEAIENETPEQTRADQLRNHLVKDLMLLGVDMTGAAPTELLNRYLEYAIGVGYDLALNEWKSDLGVERLVLFRGDVAND